MAKLAIKGHPTRGEEVIALLEMLGGINVDNLDGDDMYYYYYITDDKEIDSVLFKYSDDKARIFSLEEFEKKFPYKVGDKVLINGDVTDVYTITSMTWGGLRVVYKIRAFDGIDNVHDWFADEMKPYKEETMNRKYNVEEYLKVWDAAEKGLEVLVNDNFELKEDNGKFYIVKKQPHYPKTYEECCEVLMGKTNFQDFGLVLAKFSTTLHEEDSISPEPPHITLINNFYKLFICRDAYWKIVGEHMGLGKPWKPDWLNTEQDKFVIYTHNNVICLNRFVLGHNVLAFPTAEMRDAFLENFKELIEQCKELL